jgi:hypothetical protein
MGSSTAPRGSSAARRIKPAHKLLRLHERLTLVSALVDADHRSREVDVGLA